MGAADADEPNDAASGDAGSETSVEERRAWNVASQAFPAWTAWTAYRARRSAADRIDGSKRERAESGGDPNP